MCVSTILHFLLLSIAEGGEDNFLRNYYVIKYFGFKSVLSFSIKSYNSHEKWLPGSWIQFSR